MLQRFVQALSLLWLIVASAPFANIAAAAAPKAAPPKTEGRQLFCVAGPRAARVLEARGDARSLATAAALTFAGPPSRSKADTARAASAALEIAVRASELEPNDPVTAWLRLKLCSDAPGCDIRDAATTMRWVDADNGAAWLPTLAWGAKGTGTRFRSIGS